MKQYIVLKINEENAQDIDIVGYSEDLEKVKFVVKEKNDFQKKLKSESYKFNSALVNFYYENEVLNSKEGLSKEEQKKMDLDIQKKVSEFSKKWISENITIPVDEFLKYEKQEGQFYQYTYKEMEMKSVLK